MSHPDYFSSFGEPQQAPDSQPQHECPSDVNGGKHMIVNSKCALCGSQPQQPRGPHLLTPRNGEREYCGGPGLCKWCSESQPQQDAPDRCKHGVWKADLCYACEREATACPSDRQRITELEAALALAREALQEHHFLAISEDQAYQGSELWTKTRAALATQPGKATE